ncbi:thioredoxin-like protein [Metschnikowia bicuspidata var. bicuspidata NRRL YB-4993]|uniref:Thioredoxin-like protein n=1 Tax=Metschnikowia bicuspidata var. bicuspidata NRRL YB-4993 TaxID=869754 RepID=A0A1A0H8X0_9ASCO|nr:thioredoxin-like protein [Metschnikowia bicuspidata var. bicuspidata NRRL YB-4993]OBA20569.1 thioredoxin-like protein [Metschnikowia bicuspidata var. bicuspidata NRRL YB-4993]
MSMNDIKVPVEVDPTEDTEWNDILRSHGIIPERPKSPTEELEQALEEAVRRQHENRLESKTLGELAELEDEEDEDFLEEYKLRRFHELQSMQKKAKFGTVLHITKPEYEEEVTDASEKSYVFVHMALQLEVQSRLLSTLTAVVAQKFPEIKFTEIPANRCVENYPELNCPTIIIYHKKNIVKQYITLTQLGGNDCKISDLEKILVDIGALKASDERLEANRQDEDLEESRRLRFVKKVIRDTGTDDDEDYDFYN